MKDFDYTKLSSIYTIKRIEESNYEDILKLYKSNPQYFSYFGKEPTIETVKQDAYSLPKDGTLNNKYYLAYYDPECIAVLDLYLGYPDEETAWIGLLMIRKDLQGLSYGSEILRDILDYLTECGFTWVSLAYFKDNKQAEKFWQRNWFVPKHRIEKYDDKEFIKMIRGLQ